MPHRGEGPYVQLATFCDSVLEETTGNLSVIRMFDRLTLGTQDPNAPETMPPQALNPRLVICLKAGEAKGKHNLTLEMEDPASQPVGSMTFPLLFEGDERGINLILQFAFTARFEGLYWVNVLLKGQLLTRVPLRILYQRVSVGRLPQE